MWWSSMRGGFSRVEVGLLLGWPVIAFLGVWRGMRDAIGLARLGRYAPEQPNHTASRIADAVKTDIMSLLCSARRDNLFSISLTKSCLGFGQAVKRLSQGMGHSTIWFSIYITLKKRVSQQS